MTTLKKYKLDSFNKEVYLIDLKDSDIFSIKFVSNIGADLERILHREGKEYYGMSHLIEHLSFKSTKYISTNELKTKLKELGSHNAYTSPKEIVYFLESISQNYRDCIDSMTNIAFNTLEKLTDKELETEKSIVISEINDSITDPSSMFYDISNSIQFNLDKRDTVLGVAKDIKSYTKEDIVEFKKYLNNILFMDVFIIFDSNKLTPKEILDKLSTSLESQDLSESLIKDYNTKDIVLTDTRNNKVKMKGAFEHANLDFMSITLEIKDPDLFLGLCLLSNYISYTCKHSLFEVVREKYGKCYAIHMSSFKSYDRNFITINSQIDLGSSIEVFNHIKESVSEIYYNFNESEFNMYKSLYDIENTYSKLHRLDPIRTISNYISSIDNFIEDNYLQLSTEGLQSVIDSMDSRIRKYDLLKKSLKVLNTHIQLDNNYKYVSEYS